MEVSMNKRIIAILVTFALLLATAFAENVVVENPANIQSSLSDQELEGLGLPAGSFYVHDENSVKQFARLYIEGNSMDLLYSMFDKVLVMHVPSTYFSGQLHAVEHMLGKFVEFGEYRKIENDKTDTHILYIHFENKTEIMMLTMGVPYRVKQTQVAKSHIHGLLFAMVDKSAAPKSYKPSQQDENAKESSFSEHSLKVGKEPWLLDAVISIPDGEQASYPAVLMIGETATPDMDASFDGVPLFKDLAENLALNGVVSLRYNLRSHQYSEKINLDDSNYTVKEEILEDAVLALETLASQEKVDANKIFVLAHGNTANYLPRILEESDLEVAGLLLLGSSPLRKLEVEKSQALSKFSSLKGDDLAIAIQESLADLELAESLNNLTAQEAKSKELYGRNAYYYWEQLQDKPLEFFGTTTLPIFILHGSEDTVIPTHYGISMWSKLLGDKDNVFIKLYGGLDHFFSEGDMQPVHEDVALDLQGWILEKGAE